MEIMIFLWIIGALFTYGVILQSTDPYNMRWYHYILAGLVIGIIWPYKLGQYWILK